MKINIGTFTIEVPQSMLISKKFWSAPARLEHSSDAWKWKSPFASEVQPAANQAESSDALQLAASLSGPGEQERDLGEGHPHHHSLPRVTPTTTHHHQ